MPLKINPHLGAMTPSTKDWNIGDNTDYLMIRLSSLNLIEANGDELEHIKSRFTYYVGIPPYTTKVVSIPMGVKESMSWYGDIARTIIANL